VSLLLKSRLKNRVVDRLSFLFGRIQYETKRLDGSTRRERDAAKVVSVARHSPSTNAQRPRQTHVLNLNVFHL
jgi:hypothetical protein